MFDYTGSEMRGQEWGRLYGTYHKQAYSKRAVDGRLEELMADPQVTDKRGVIEYILGGETEKRLLNVRVFDKRTTKAVYRRQTDAAKAAGVSNCPMCAASACADGVMNAASRHASTAAAFPMNRDCDVPIPCGYALRGDA